MDSKFVDIYEGSQELHEAADLGGMLESDDIEEFEDLRQEIIKLAKQAYRITRAAQNTNVEARARSYWYGHILSAAGDPEYGDKSPNMAGTVRELKDEVFGEEEDDGSDPNFGNY